MFIYLFIWYVSIFAYMYVNHTHAWCPQRSEKGICPLELELWTVVSSHMGTRN